MSRVTQKPRADKIAQEKKYQKKDSNQQKTRQQRKNAQKTLISSHKNTEAGDGEFQIKTPKGFTTDDFLQVAELIDSVLPLHQNKIPYPLYGTLDNARSILAGLGQKRASALTKRLSEDELKRIRSAAAVFVDSLSPTYTKGRLEVAIPVFRDEILNGESRDLLMLINTVNRYCECAPEREDFTSRYAVSIHRRWPRGTACKIARPSKDPEFFNSVASIAIDKGDSERMERILFRLSKLPEARQKEFWIQQDSNGNSILTQAFLIGNLKLNGIIEEALLESNFTPLEKAEIFREGTRWSEIQTETTALIKEKLAALAKSLISAHHAGVDANFFKVLMTA